MRKPKSSIPKPMKFYTACPLCDGQYSQGKCMELPFALAKAMKKSYLMVCRRCARDLCTEEFVEQEVEK